MVALYADDASMDMTVFGLPQVAPHYRVRGKTNIYIFWQRAFSGTRPGDLTLTPLEMRVDGDRVYETGRYFVTVYRDDRPVVESGGYFWIWKKSAKDWKILKSIVWSYGDVQVLDTSQDQSHGSLP